MKEYIVCMDGGRWISVLARDPDDARKVALECTGRVYPHAVDNEISYVFEEDDCRH